MADFTAVLRKTIAGLEENTPETRQKVYDKARATIDSKLAAASAAPEVVERQKKLLEDAVAEVEAEHTPAAAPPQDDLDAVLAGVEAEAEPGPEEASPEDVADDEATLAADETTVSGPEDEIGAPAAPPADQGRAPARRRGYAGIVVALAVVLILGSAAYAVWLNRDAVAGMFGFSQWPVLAEQEADAPAETDAETEGEAATETSADAAGDPTTQADETPQAEAEPPEDAGETATASGDGTETSEDDQTPVEAPDEKFTQRLLPGGEEVDPGPAGGETSIGEGTSVAPSTQETAGEDDAAGTEDGRTDDTAAAQQGEQVPVEQEAIFYEERTTSAEGSADSGSVVWSLVEESSGDDQSAQPAIRAEATIPGKDLRLRMTISRNDDPSLPASHIIEIIFFTPDDFSGGGIDDVVRFAMKGSEEDAGRELRSTKAKIADGYFLIALNDTEADIESNMTLLRRQSWIDVTVLYKSGRRALLTMEKGIPGDETFRRALESWQSESSG